VDFKTARSLGEGSDFPPGLGLALISLSWSRPGLQSITIGCNSDRQLELAEVGAELEIAERYGFTPRARKGG
jgi:hypothetical protein